MEATYRQCSKTLMDTIADPNITFDQNGVSNYWHTYQKLEQQKVHKGEEGLSKIERIFDKIKQEGKGKPYDCITGVSGGVDSTYLAYITKKYGLRPLIIHLDNGWNSEIATRNINNIIETLGFDLYTHVIDWEEFRDLQLSFLKASVVDLELTSDHAIFSVIYDLAVKHKIKYMLSGFNVVTEGILPSAWRWNKMDWLNIKAIHKKFGKTPLRTFPHISFSRKVYLDKVLSFETIQPLNYLPYNKEEIKKVITEEMGWQDYGGKHYESIITRFYQGYILPEKFRIDKRKAHLSTLIAAGQLSKEQALEEISKPIYDPQTLQMDKEFVLKKFELSEDEFQKIMKAPIHPHNKYDSYETKHYKYHKQFFDTIAPIRKVIGI